LEAHGGGGGSWDIFLRTLQSAADGLSMAMGQRNYSKSQLHHVVPHSHKKYSPEHKEIADRYNYELASQENIISLNGHCGRHTKEYHDFISLGLNELDRIAIGSKSAFHEGMGIIKEFVKNNPWLPYAKTRK
jgi:hypothetical protein